MLLDGYDEIAEQSQENLHRSHQLERWPHLKMIVTCRSQYLTAGYEGWFMPFQGGWGKAELLQVATLAAFSPTQIDTYITT